MKVTNDSATTLGTKETTDDDTMIDETMNETSFQALFWPMLYDSWFIKRIISKIYIHKLHKLQGASDLQTHIAIETGPNGDSGRSDAYGCGTDKCIDINDTDIGYHNSIPYHDWNERGYQRSRRGCRLQEESIHVPKVQIDVIDGAGAGAGAGFGDGATES